MAHSLIMSLFNIIIHTWRISDPWIWTRQFIPFKKTVPSVYQSNMKVTSGFSALETQQIFRENSSCSSLNTNCTLLSLHSQQEPSLLYLSYYSPVRRANIVDQASSSYQWPSWLTFLYFSMWLLLKSPLHCATCCAKNDGTRQKKLKRWPPCRFLKSSVTPLTYFYFESRVHSLIWVHMMIRTCQD